MAQQPLSIYLIRDNYNDFDDILDTKLELERFPIAPGGAQGVMYFLQHAPASPSWLEFLRPLHSGLPTSVTMSRASALVVLRVQYRLFALPFGNGRHFLATEAIEQNFGLRVVVNAVDAGKLKAVDATSLDVIAIEQRRQTAKRTSMLDFRVDLERDLLMAATGEPKNIALLGNQITGKDSFHLSKELAWHQVPALLESLLDLAASDDYKQDFGWIDQFSLVRDSSMIQNLLEEVNRRFEIGDPVAFTLAVPEVIDWQTIKTYRYQKPKQGTPFEDLNWSECLGELGLTEPINVDDLVHRTIYAFGADDNEYVHRWPVWKCLSGDLELGGIAYVLNHGNWYRVDNDFVDRVNNRVDAIPTPGFTFCDCQHPNEDHYIDALRDSHPGFLTKMHTRIVSHGGGSSRIEICDAISSERHLVHIKNYESSQSLSYLFTQGATSARLIMNDATFRQKMNDHLPDECAALRFATPSQRPTPAEWRVVYGVIGANRRNSELPLLGRISLYNAADTLANLGVGVELSHISGKYTKNA